MTNETKWHFSIPEGIEIDQKKIEEHLGMDVEMTVRPKNDTARATNVTLTMKDVREIKTTSNDGYINSINMAALCEIIERQQEALKWYSTCEQHWRAIEDGLVDIEKRAREALLNEE